VRPPTAAARYSVYWLYWYKSTNTDLVVGGVRRHAGCCSALLSFLVLLVQKYKY
jgi:hypothetical protein